jgi:hypothetical protein
LPWEFQVKKLAKDGECVSKCIKYYLDQIQFEVGNAVDLVSVLNKKEVNIYLGVEHSPTFDVVLALDCAYHFQFRNDFVQQVTNSFFFSFFFFFFFNVSVGIQSVKIWRENRTGGHMSC